LQEPLFLLVPAWLGPRSRYTKIHRMRRFRHGATYSLGKILLSICLWSVPLVYLLYSLIILKFVSQHSYSELLLWYGRSWPGSFDLGKMGRDCFTEDWYNRLKTNSEWLTALIVAIMVVYGICSRAVWKFLFALLHDIAFTARFLARSFTDCRGGQKVALLSLFGAIMAYWIYIFAHSPFFGDEATSYVYFARHGFLLTVISYPIPNNHILLNVLCGWLHKIPLGPALVMRLPSMATASLMYYGIFCLFRYWSDFQRAMVVTAGVAFCHILSFYAVSGRGYQLQMLFTVVSAMSVWAYWFSGERRGRSGFALFIVASVLGFYVNPLFIYHFLALMMIAGFVFLKNKDHDGGKSFLRAILLIGVLVLIFYLPLLLVSRPGSVLENRFVAGNLPWNRLVKDFPIFLYDIKYDLYYGYFALYMLPGAVLLSLWLYHRRMIAGRFYDWGLYYFVATLLAILVVTLYKHIYPLERSLSFWVLAINIIFVNVVYDGIRYLFLVRKPPVLLSGSAIWAAGLVSLFLLVKIGISVRLLYWDKYHLQNDKSAIVCRQVGQDISDLAALHPASWQVTDDDNNYPVQVRLYLSARGEESKVFDRQELCGDILFLPPDAPLPDPTKYQWWANRGKSPAEMDWIAIYVSKRLLKAPQ
jgi:hypothetical protein